MNVVVYHLEDAFLVYLIANQEARYINEQALK